ncbi:MAG: hypothetical protein Q9159_006720 [Coniocarpon cinnabarinum]
MALNCQPSFTCGASNGKRPAYLDAARSLAEIMHRHNIKLVYGGGTLGMMGEVAKTLVALSGPDSVHGIIPEALLPVEASLSKPDSEAKAPPSPASGKYNVPDSSEFGKTTVVQSMHERKTLMAKEVYEGGPGSAFVALPGGFGTVEEFFEMTTWNQLGIHDRPVIYFNVAGYWNKMMEWIQESVNAGFIVENNAGIVRSATDAEGVIRAIQEYEPSTSRLNTNDWNIL